MSDAMPPAPSSLHGFPWDQLSQESTQQTCDGYVTTLRRWLGREGLPATLRGQAARLEPLLSLRPAAFEDAEEPFVPYALYRSLQAADLSALNDIANIPLPDARALLADLAWKKRACNHQTALAAVADYTLLAFFLHEPRNWLPSVVRLTRALLLAKTLRDSLALERTVRAIEILLEKTLTSATPYFAGRFAALLLEHELGDAEALERIVGTLAEKARDEYTAKGIGDGGLCEVERHLLDIRMRLLQRLKRQADAKAVRVEIAEAFVRQAQGVIAAEWPGACLVAAHFTLQAVEQYRKLGGYGERIEALCIDAERLQREAAQTMEAVTTHVDLGGPARQAQERVAGKPPVLALYTLATLHSPPTYEALATFTRKQLSESPFRSFVPHSYIGPRGNEVVSHGGVLGDDADPGFIIEVKREAHYRQTLIALGVLAHAARQIALEHGPSAADLCTFLRCGAFVPESRIRSYARGLAAGLYGDFELAAALLFPQLEHCVRELFFSLGKATRSFPTNGAENEWDLNRLLSERFAEEVFGPELAFDLRVLLIDKAGGNLRNKLAHGLVDDGGDIGAKAYLWWICLRLSFFRAESKRGTGTPARHSNGTQA